jgi:hypothetical protein
MENLPLLLGGSWASGINLYLTVAVLGIAHRVQWISLPGQLEALSHPIVIAVAVILFLIEFVADKIPYVDSAWDSVHTFIRPAGGALIGYLAMAGYGQEWQLPVALLTGSIAMESHLTKATARLAINTSPEPVTNSIASVTEDLSVIGIMYLIIKHPVIASLVIIGLLIVSIWFLKKMFHLIKKIFSPRKPEELKKETA